VFLIVLGIWVQRDGVLTGLEREGLYSNIHSGYDYTQKCHILAGNHYASLEDNFGWEPSSGIGIGGNRPRVDDVIPEHHGTMT
jgi:hypothetical protein